MTVSMVMVVYAQTLMSAGQEFIPATHMRAVLTILALTAAHAKKATLEMDDVVKVSTGSITEASLIS